MPGKLKSSNPRTSERRILAAARTIFQRPRWPEARVFYEHGQWFLEDVETGDLWSVVDAEGGQSIDGFDFEPLSTGVGP